MRLLSRSSRVAPETTAPHRPSSRFPSGRALFTRRRRARGSTASSKQASEPALTLIMLGCDNAGKTTLAAALAAKSVTMPGPTVGFKKGDAKRRGSPITLFDVGGGPNIRGIWPDYFAPAHAAVFVVDAADSARFEEAKALLVQATEHECLRGKPLLILANKQDLPHAAGPSEIAEALEVHRLEELASKADADAPSLGCHVAGSSLGDEASLVSAPSVGDGSELDRALTWLVDTLQVRYPVLQQRVEAEMAAQEEAQRKRKEERKARLAAKRAAREKEEAEAAAKEAAAAQSQLTDGVDVGLPLANPTKSDSAPP